MNGDLISRSALLQKIQDDKEFLRKGLGKDAEYAYMSADSVIEKIKSMSVAYDREKVIDMIEQLEGKSIPRYKGENLGDYEGIDYYVKKSEVAFNNKLNKYSDNFGGGGVTGRLLTTYEQIQKEWYKCLLTQVL